MARRISAGVAGGSGFGGLTARSATVTAADNQDITFNPEGTGRLLIDGDAQLQSRGDLRFADADNSNYVAFEAPENITTNIIWTLPGADGSSDQVLTTGGTGTLSWTDKTIDITNNTSNSTQHNVLLTTASSGSVADLTTTDTKLQFQPSTGLLSVTELTVNGTSRNLSLESVLTASHTIVLADRNKVVAMNNTAAADVTVPPDSTTNFPVGSVINIARVNTGAVGLIAGAGVTLSKTGNLGANEEIIVRKRSANNWLVIERPYNLTGSGGTVTTSGSFRIHSYTSTGAGTFTVQT